MPILPSGGVGRSRNPSDGDGGGEGLAYELTLVQIRERSFLEILDLAWWCSGVGRSHLGWLRSRERSPFAVFNAWISHERDLPFLGYLFTLAAPTIPWATAPLTIVLGGLMFAERPTVGRVLKTLIRSFGSMFLFQFLLRGFLLIAP